MEGFKEFQGKDLDDAIGQACSYYDTLREKLEIDIVHDSKSGIFGIVGARKAKIKARRVQLRNAVDSILGRGRGASAPEAPPDSAPADLPDAETPSRENEKIRAGESAKAPEAAENARPGDKNRKSESARNGDARNGENTGENGRKPRAPRPPRPPRNLEKSSPEYRNDGTSILTGHVLGVTAETENDEEASYGPGNEIPQELGNRAERSPKERAPRGERPPRFDRSERPDRADRADRPDRADKADRPERADRAERPDRTDRSERPERSDRPARGNRPPRGGRPLRGEAPADTAPQGQVLHVNGIQNGGAPGSFNATNANASPVAPGTPSVLAGTLDGDALNEDALSEGLPIIPFDQLDQERLRALSLEAVGRLVEPIVGTVPLTVELGDSRVNVVLDCGEDSGLLIGREGQTLASLQYLASRLVSRAMGAAVRVQLDAGEYRLRQDEKLRELALILADRVRSTGKSHSTRPLSSYHRRIVHMALQEAPDVQTRSSGDGALKRVVIQRKRGN